MTDLCTQFNDHLSLLAGKNQIFPDKKLLILTTAKNGTTSISSWYLHQIGLAPRQSSAKSPAPQKVLRLLSDATKLQLGKSDFIQAILSRQLSAWQVVKPVRNPYLRAVSIYCQVLRMMGPMGKLSFSEFLELPMHYFFCSHNIGESHATTQASYLETKHGLTPDYVYEISSGIHELCSYLESTFSLKKETIKSFNENKMRYSESYDLPQGFENYSDIIFSGRDFATGKTPPPANLMLDEGVKRNIFNIYREDFKLYGFNKETGELPCRFQINSQTDEMTEAEVRRLDFLNAPRDGNKYIRQSLIIPPYDPEWLPDSLAIYYKEMSENVRKIDNVPQGDRILILGTGKLFKDLLLDTKLHQKNVVGITDVVLPDELTLNFIEHHLNWSFIRPENLSIYGNDWFNKILLVTDNRENLSTILDTLYASEKNMLILTPPHRARQQLKKLHN